MGYGILWDKTGEEHQPPFKTIPPLWQSTTDEW